MTVTADTPGAQAPHGDASTSAHQPLPEPLRAQLAGILGSMRRLVDLQISIWLARAKTVVLRIVLFLTLALMSLLVAFAAVIWAYAGLYRVLTDILHFQTAWALLIFAGMHLLLAAILGFSALTLLRGPKPTQKSPEVVR